MFSSFLYFVFKFYPKANFTEFSQILDSKILNCYGSNYYLDIFAIKVCLPSKSVHLHRCQILVIDANFYKTEKEKEAILLTCCFQFTR